MISFDAALALLDQHVSPLASELLPLRDAADRVLAEDVVAAISSPRSTVSAMDGYAVAECITGDAMTVVGEARPNAPAGTGLAAGEAVRIFTGATVPDGTDRIIVQEYARRENGLVRFVEGHGPARHIREEGSDFASGDTILAKGARIGPKTAVAIAAGDIGEVRVARRPQVALLATGDELVEPGHARNSGASIPDSIGYALAMLVEQAGGGVVERRRLRDDLPALEKAAGEALAAADLVIVTGGASVGERDFAKPMFAAHGLDVIFEKVAIRPGKPVWLGRAGRSIVLGLPGNPTSAMVTARLFLMPLLQKLQGGGTTHRWRMMPLAAPLPATGERETFARASWDVAGLRPLGNQDSGVQGGLAHADWLIRCPPGQAALSSGQAVRALQF